MAARRAGRGGRPRLFENGVRVVGSSIPEDDARLVELVAIRRGASISNVVAQAVWTMLEEEGLTPTWGVPDAQRTAGAKP